VATFSARRAEIVARQALFGPFGTCRHHPGALRPQQGPQL